jgi:hypothetical protein
MTAPAEPLDHVVVNVLRGMDAAAELFAGLGFTLTPLGRHSLGSINHLMVAPGAYLELVGVPAEGKQRQEVLDSPFGLNGLVFRSTDADATYARLKGDDLQPSEPVAFSRPVEIDGRTLDASFRTVRVPNGLFPAGRVYFCQHLTPELVWRDDWLGHPNGFCGFDRIAVGSSSPEIDAARYVSATDADAEPHGAGWRITVGDFAIDVEPAERPRFTALGLRFKRFDELAERAAEIVDVDWVEEAHGVATLRIPALELRIECRSVT